MDFRNRNSSSWIAWLGAMLAALASFRGAAAGPPSASQPPVAASEARASFRPEVLREIDSTIEQAIAQGKLPGGVFWLEHGGTTYRHAYGRRSISPTLEPMTEDTIFDLASLTKVLATAPAIMILLDRGQLALDAPLHRYVPEFGGDARDSGTLRQLLTHTSGLAPGLSRVAPWSGYAAGIQVACDEPVLAPGGRTFHYSDVGFILLGEVVRRIGGRPLDEFAQNELYGPLRMLDTKFLPPATDRGRIAPTERANGEMLRGQVHDPTARRMGGVAGHAGLFGTAADLARFARMMLNGGELEGARILTRQSVKLMTSVQSPAATSARRGLGWDIDSPYSGPRGAVFPVGSYGHTGWTGTSLWIDPFSKSFVIFLSHRNHPDGGGDVIALRRRLGTLAAQAIADFDFNHVAGALTTNSAAGAVEPRTP